MDITTGRVAHPPPPISAKVRLSDMLKQTNADGFFGDTISSAGLQV